MTGTTRRLAEFAAGIDYAALPPDVVERARMLLMDQVGISIRGRNDAGLSASMAAALRRLGLAASSIGGAATGNVGGATTGRIGGAEPPAGASVIGDAASYSPPAAALFNGNLGHSLDFDDTHASGSIHPSAPIVPAALAAAEMAKADGRAVVAAVVAGYEVQIRLSLALGPSEHYRRGFHPTATCGVFGAAAAAGRVLGLDPSRMEDALGLCGSLAAGSMQFLADGAWNKPFHTGYAAMNGLVAACMAREGFRGAREAIEGRAGFLHAYAPNADPALASEELGERWETLRIAIKPYPSCRYSHAPMDALIALRGEHGIDWRDVESVEIGLSRTGWNLIGDPEDEKQRPETYVDGQFSMPFCAAVALRDGALTWDSYDTHLGDADTLGLCRRVRTAVDQRVEADFPGMAGLARITTRRGGVYEQYVKTPRGEPENFLTREELKAKFDGLAAPYMGANRRDALAEALLAIDEADDVAGVLRMTRPVETDAPFPGPEQAPGSGHSGSGAGALAGSGAAFGSGATSGSGAAFSVGAASGAVSNGD